MTLTIDGQLQQIHPMTEAMIVTLLEGQDLIVRQGYGLVELYFAPHEVTLKLLASPLVRLHRKTKDKSRLYEPLTR